MKKVLKNSLIVIIITIVIILSLEGLVRIWGYSEKEMYDPIFMKYAGSADIPFILKPNLIKARDRGNIYIYTNNIGLRTAGPGEVVGPKKENEFRIAFIGDSITFGRAVKADETFCMVVQRVLNKDQNIKVVKAFNFGVSSYSVKEMAATLKYRVSIADPDLVVICAITDDFSLGRCAQLDRYGYLSRPGWGESPVGSFLFSIVREMHLTYPVRDIIRDVIANLYYKKMENPEIIPSSYTYILEAKDIAEKRRLGLVFVALPLWGTDESHFAPILKRIHDDGITYCDTSSLGTKYSEKEWCPNKYDFLHPSAMVHEAIGRKIAACIERYVVNKQ